MRNLLRKFVKRKRLVVILLASALMAPAYSDAADNRLVPVVDVTQASYTAKDKIQLTTVTRLPNSCYEYWQTSVRVGQEEIIITPVARQAGQVCLMRTRYVKTKLGIPAMNLGVYDVIDGDTAKKIGVLWVDDDRVEVESYIQ